MCRKPDYIERNTDLQKVTVKHYHVKLYQIYLNNSCNRIHNTTVCLSSLILVDETRDAEIIVNPCWLENGMIISKYCLTCAYMKRSLRKLPNHYIYNGATV